MKIRHLLAVATASAAVASASAFEWTPVITQPYAGSDLYYFDSLGIVSFNCTEVNGEVSPTETMPKWIDDDGNEIVAVSCVQDPWGWDPTEFQYSFNKSDFKSNGEYVLLFPEGMLVNAAKEKSAEKKNYYTIAIPELDPPMFEDFKVLSITPDFSQPQGYWDNQVVTIDTNHNDAIGLVELTITDNDAEDPLQAIVVNSSSYSTGRELGNASAISYTVEGKYKFLEGHTYTAELILYNGKDAYGEMGVPTKYVTKLTYEFTGKIEGYKYSDIKLLSIDPKPGTLAISEPSQAIFTYTFSGPVNVYRALTPQGQNGNNVYPESCLSSNSDKTVWTLNLSEDSFVKTMDAELEIYVYAKDLDGYQLKGNFGEEAESCFTGVWTCDIGAKEIVVVTPEKGQTINRLTEIVVKSVSGEAMSYNWGEIAIQNHLGERIGTLCYEPVEGEETATEFHFTQWFKEDADFFDPATPLDIVKEGSYVIYIPTGTFVFGDQSTSVNSRSLYSGFSIGAGSAIESVAVVSESDVYDMQGRIVLRDASAEAVKSLEKGIYIVGGKKVVVK